MLSNHKLQVTIEELREISRMDMSLYNEGGKLVASTCEQSPEMEKNVSHFINSMAESQTLGGTHFFKVISGDELTYVLLVASSAEEGYLVGKMAAAQIRRLVEAYQEQFDKNHFMQNILLGNLLVVDMYNKARKLRIEQIPRVVFVVEVEGHKDSTIMETAKNLFGNTSRDFVTEVEEQDIIIVKDVRDLTTEEDLENLALMILDTLQSEAMTKVRVGYGNRADQLTDLTKSYQEAKMAIEVGKIFYAEKKATSYARLGIGRLIYQIPMSLCEMFIHEVYGSQIPDIFSEENMVTIQKFFDNNLNISETARQLYVHRNTLVYRLERLEKILGLDIRKFEDAMIFKIALMVMSNMANQKGVDLAGITGSGEAYGEEQ